MQQGFQIYLLWWICIISRNVSNEMELEDAATNISNRMDFGRKEMTNILLHD